MTDPSGAFRPTPATPATPATSRRATIVRVAIVIAAVGALILLGRQLGGLLPRVTAAVEALGVWGPVAFIAAYAVACIAFVPASLLTLGAGALFGVVRGTIFVLIGATLGALGAFLIARYLARDWVEARVSRDARFAAIDTAIAAQGRRVVFLLRLSPVIPFNVLNYALGLTKVRMADFLIASAGMLPGTLLYVYTGRLASVVVGASGADATPRGPAFYAVLGLGLAATAAVTVLITRLAKRALASATATPASSDVTQRTSPTH